MMKSGTGGSAFTWHPSTSPHLASHGVSNQECCCICLTALVISATVIASPLHICTCSGRKRYHPWGEQLSALEHGLPAFHSAPGCLLFTFPWRHSLGCSLLWNLPNSYLLLPQRASLIPSIASYPEFSLYVIVVFLCLLLPQNCELSQGRSPVLFSIAVLVSGSVTYLYLMRQVLDLK